MAITVKDTCVRHMVEGENSVLTDWICCFQFHRTHTPKPQKKNLFPTSDACFHNTKLRADLPLLHTPCFSYFQSFLDTSLCFKSISTKDGISVNVYKPFRRKKQGGRGGEVALCIREGSDYLELNDGDYRVKCLQERIRGKGNKTDITQRGWRGGQNIVRNHTISSPRSHGASPTYQVSAGNSTQERGKGPGDSWNVGKRNSCHSWWVSQPGRASLDLFFVNRGGLVGDVLSALGTVITKW